MDTFPVSYSFGRGHYQYSSVQEILKLLLSRARDSFQENSRLSTTRLSIFALCEPLDPYDDLTYQTINDLAIAPKQKLKKLPCLLSRTSQRSFLRYNDGEGEQPDISGSFKDIEDVAEGRVWVETEPGHRVPREYYLAESRFEATPLQVSTIQEFHFDQSSEFHGTLFEKEQREGRTLLRMEESDDFEGYGHLTRDFTVAEQEYKAELEAEGNTGKYLLWKLKEFRYGRGINMPFI